MNFDKSIYPAADFLFQLAEILNPHLPDWFQEFKKDYNLNIAIVDFLTPTLINQLVNLNLAE